MMERSMEEKLPRAQLQNQLEALVVQDAVLVEVQAEGLELAAQEVQVRVLVEDQEQAAREVVVPVAVVVAAVVVEEVPQETLQEDLAEAGSMDMVMMMTPRTIQIKGRKRILQEEGAHGKNRASLVVAKVEKVASSPGSETISAIQSLS